MIVLCKIARVHKHQEEGQTALQHTDGLANKVLRKESVAMDSSTSNGSRGPTRITIPLEDVKETCNAGDCCGIADGKVYDLSRLEHAGGLAGEFYVITRVYALGRVSRLFY